LFVAESEGLLVFILNIYLFLNIYFLFYRMWHDTPVFISISELVLRALVLDQKRQSSKGSIGLDNADVGLILGSVIIRLSNFLFFFLDYLVSFIFIFLL
jgi:hypothetical protein